MSKKEKSLKRIKSAPKDFKWSELAALMISLGYELVTVGGSGRKFVWPENKSTLFIHEPHPAKVLKQYQVRDVIYHLRKDGHIK